MVLQLDFVYINLLGKQPNQLLYYKLIEEKMSKIMNLLRDYKFTWATLITVLYMLTLESIIIAYGSFIHHEVRIFLYVIIFIPVLALLKLLKDKQ